MIFVDPREGSGDIRDRLTKRNVPAEHLLLPYGDVTFVGRGVRGAPKTIGIEVKTIHELVSAFDNGRFVSKQLPGLVQEHDYAWLIVEGTWRENKADGVLEVPHGTGWSPMGFGSKRFMAHDFTAFLFTLQYRGGLLMHHTGSREQTIQWLCSHYRWWTVKDFEQHRSRLSFHTPPPPDRVLFIKPTLVRRMAKELEGVGWEKSDAVAKRFETPLEMCIATRNIWEEIAGIGKTLSERIVLALRGRL